MDERSAGVFSGWKGHSGWEGHFVRITSHHSSLSPTRRIVVALAGLLVIAACCYPPYQAEVFDPADGKVTEERV
jgi:hypothetical protein